MPRQHRPISENRIDIWFDTALEPVEYLRADFQDFAFPLHLHETFAIGIIESGAQKFRSKRGQAEMMSEGTLCAINPGEVHEGSAGVDGGWRYRMFYPTEDLVSRALHDDLDARAPNGCLLDAHVISDVELYGRFLSLHDASSLGASLLERETRIILFLRELFTRHGGYHPAGTSKRLPRTANLVRELLHARYTEAVSIGELSAEAGVSETQIIRSFSEEVGMAPHAYLIALRIECAKRLIRSGRSIAEVADETGFSDQSHLHRHFRRVTGVTPGTFARAVCSREVRNLQDVGT